MLKIIVALTAIICALAASTVHAGTVTLEWGAVNGAEGYRVYRMPIGEQPITTPQRTPELTVHAPATTGTLSVPNGAHAFFVTEYNAWGESEPSNIVQTPPLPVAPGTLRVVVNGTLVIQ